MSEAIRQWFSRVTAHEWNSLGMFYFISWHILFKFSHMKTKKMYMEYTFCLCYQMYAVFAVRTDVYLLL